MGDDTEEMEVDVPEQVGESHPVQKRFFKAQVRYMKEYCLVNSFVFAIFLVILSDLVVLIQWSYLD